MMKLKLITGLVLSLFLIGMLILAFNIQPVRAEPETIYIRGDGSVEGTDKIQRDGSVYTFTANIYESIVIERNNIVIDGAEYTLQGSGSGYGFSLSGINNVTIKNTNIKAFTDGIYLYQSSSNTLSGNNITTNNYCGICLAFSSNNGVSGNNIVNNQNGVFLYYSLNNVLSGNNITTNIWYGIWLGYSPNNSISGNNMANNCGIFIEYSNCSSIIGNTFLNDGLSIYRSYWHKVKDNTVNAKPLVYLERVSNFTVEDAGQVILINCDDIRVENLNLSCTAVGLELLGTKNSKIADNNITGNKECGIRLYQSSKNSISANNIANNWDGIGIHWSSRNYIFHNNFVNNTDQVFPPYGPYGNVWDNGYPSGGNYWSDYNGTDFYRGQYQNVTGSDGIGDTPYIIDAYNKDRHPLMNPWTPTETSVRVKGKDYPITIVSNTTLDQIVATTNILHFRSSGPTGEKGYVNVIFPMVNTTEIKVFIDGKKLTPPPFPVINTNGTHYFIYFEFTLSTHDIDIEFAPKAPVGGTIVPINKLELLMPYIGVVSVILVTITVVVKKRKLNYADRPSL